jgi:hypothetical protein
MKNEKIVTINGRQYDKNTGLPINKPVSKHINAPDKNIKSAKNIQTIAVQPKTLYSRVAQKTFNDIRSPRRKISHNMDIAKSKHVSHFAPDTTSTAKAPNPPKKDLDAKPVVHPMAAKVGVLRANAKNLHDSRALSQLEKSAKTIKNEAITEALSKTTKPKKQRNNFFIRNKKYVNIFSICVAILIIAGGLIYMNINNISFHIASMQAGISATYPEYYPDGYSIDGPVSYSNGEVTINFRANTGDSKFVIKQSKSLFDESALKIQVDKDSNYQTSESQEGGLTIYTYNDNNNAEWVNGGILYSITGNAKLSSDQIRQIATNL